MSGPTLLREMNSEDLDLVRSWRNHPEILKYMYTRHQITVEEHRDWFNTKSADSACKLLIFEKEGVAQGFVQLGLDYSTRKSSWGFYAAPGSPRGIGTLLGAAVLQYVFVELDFEEIIAEVMLANSRSIKFHRKMGFRQRRTLKSKKSGTNDLIDIVCMSQTRSDWENRQQGTI